MSHDSWCRGSVNPASDHLPAGYEGNVIERFDAQVGQTPDLPAVVDAARSLSYKELQQQTNRVANALAGRGIGPKGIVPLVTAHTSNRVAAAIGVMKAGMAWAPVDVSLNDRALMDLVTFSEAKLIVADEENIDRCRQWGIIPDENIINVASLCASDHPPMVAIDGADVSDVCFTSGSTSTPKGVIRTHAQTAYNAARQIDFMKMGPGDRVILNRIFWTSSVFSTLNCGACLYPYDLKTQGLAGMGEWLDRHDITVFNGIVTGFREFLVNLAPSQKFEAMRIVALVGEPITLADVEKFDRHFAADCSLVHYYACTEQTRITDFVVDRQHLPKGSVTVPIGYAVPGVEVRLLDEERKPVAEGETGEMAVIDEHLSPGYLFDEERSKAAWTEIGGERVYLTGDLARLEPDGRLIHQGRKDQQLKVRGHRIIPSEIEDYVVQHPDIKQAVVTHFEGEDGKTKLACYYRADVDPGTKMIRRFVMNNAPVYMLPHYFVHMDEFPLTSSGKVLRRELPAPVADVSEIADTGPVSELETQLLDIFREHLETPDLRVTDDFFAHGGDSLLGLVVIMEVSQRIGIELDLRHIFDAPTAREFATLVESGQVGNESRVYTLSPGSEDGLPVYALLGINAYQALAETCECFGPFHAVYLEEESRLFSRDQAARAGLSTDYFAERYAEIIDEASPEGPMILVGFSYAGILAVEAAIKLEDRGRTVDRIILLDTSLDTTFSRDWGKWIRYCVRALTEPGLLDKVRRKLNLMPKSRETTTPTEVRDLIHVFRRSERRTYRGPKRTPRARSLLIKVSNAKRRNEGVRFEADYGWGKYLGNSLEICELEGEHFSMLESPTVVQVSRTIDANLRE